MPISVEMVRQRHSLIFISFIPKMSVFLLCLVLSREWGNGLRGLPYIGDYIGTTIGIHSPIPY